jgi:hypothetical protein
MVNFVRNIEENIKDKQIRNPYKKVGSLTLWRRSFFKFFAHSVFKM